MEGTISSLTKRIMNVGDKTKKIADVYYLAALFVFLSSYSCSLTKTVLGFIPVVYLIGSLMLFPVGIYRIFIALFKNWKLAAASIVLILFAVIYSNYSSEVVPFTFIAFAIVGALGVCADKILYVGIGSNIVMIIYNIFVTSFTESGLFSSEYTANDFLFFGNDSYFYFSKMNNVSSTDFAAHYFWIFAAYFWIRGKKITWAEIITLGFLDIVVYSLTGSNTTLIGLSFLLLCASGLKIWLFGDKKFKLTDMKPDKFRAGRLLSKVVSLFCKYSFPVFAVFCILIAALYDTGNPVLYRLNILLHKRLGLGHRGIVEQGIHLISSDVPSYGGFTSADGFFNYLDCSYVFILINCGVLLLLFYLCSMTLIQIRHKNYFYGVMIIAVCALSCIEEHHLAGINYNFFIFLLLADIKPEEKTAVPVIDGKDRLHVIIKVSSTVFCVILAVSAFMINYPRYSIIKNIDSLDARAGQIYDLVQIRLDDMSKDGAWQNAIKDMSSDDYGDILDNPDDYVLVTDSYWEDSISDPKLHSYYSVYYDGRGNTDNYGVLDLLLTDEIKGIIGSGICIIEYDAADAKVYSVWFSESEGCYVIPGGRDSRRMERTRTDLLAEGYYTGVSDA